MGILSDFGYTDENNSSYDDPPRPPADIPEQKDDDLPSAIIATANKIGINPLDLATAISYETGGTFNPRLLGPETKNGQGRGIGLIQFMSNGAAKDYGVTRDTSISDQLKAAGRYLVDRGVKAGMGLLDIYSAINAGHVGLYDRSDANNGGAPGTVRDKVENQMAGHRIKAAKLLGFRNFDTPQVTPASTPNYPGYVPPTGPRREGSAEGIGYVSDDNGGWRPAEPGEAPQAMFYGEPRNHPRATPAYIRSGTPGVQASYVPPEMRGPFRKQPTPLETGLATVGAPTTDVIPDMGVPAMPGTAQEPMPPINEQLAKLLISNVPSEPETTNLMDESAGLNLTRTASNISIPSQDQQNVLTTTPPSIAPPDTPPAVTPPPVPAKPVAAATPASAPAPAPTPQPEEHSSFMDMLDSAYQGAKSVLNDTQLGVRQAAAKGVGAINAMPSQAAAAVLSVPSLFGYNETLPAAKAVVDYAERGKQAANTLFGVDDNPKTLFQGAGALAGRNIAPWGKYTLAATGISAGVDMASHIIERANAKTVTKDEAEALLFPGVGNNNQSLPGPRVSHTVMTSAGPAQLDPANYKLLGVIGAATIGAIAMPSAARLLLNTKLGTSLLGRTGRVVTNAPQGVEAFSNISDLLHTATHDKYGGLMRIADGLGVDPRILDEMRTKFDFQTGGATRNLTNSAVINGDMKAPNFSFKVDTPVLKLAAAEDMDTTRYMHLYHTYDQIRQAEQVLLKTSAANVQQVLATSGPPRVRGMDKSQVRAEIANMEAGPNGQQLKDFRTEYRKNLSAFRNFLYQGEYATLSREGYHIAQRTKQNEIFQKDLDVGNTDAGIQKASQTLGDAMQEQMRKRMENEAIGYYMDQMTAHEPNFARQVTAAELKANQKSWGPRTVSFYRRGKKEYWVTDPMVADVMRLDPYYMNGTVGGILVGSRKVIEQTTTGRFAPWFAFTNASRNYNLAKVSPEPGFVAPNLANVVAAVPQTLYPQAAKFISQKLDDWSAGYIGQTFPNAQQTMHSLSVKLAQVFDQSMYHTLEKSGGIHTSGFINYNLDASSKIKQITQSLPVSAAKTFLSGLSNTLEAIHNSSNFAYAKKNIKRGVSVDRAAMSARQLTGDPQRSGQMLMASGKPIAFNTESFNLFQKASVKGVQGVGHAFELGRNLLPWFNVTTQGMARVGKAYLDNPAKFVQRMYLHSMIPAGALYMYNRGLGVDPNGISYNDYQMNRRSPYKSFMFWYIGIPGRPAEDGLEIPLPHETATASAMMAAAMHHLTHSDLFSRADDYIRAALSFVGKDYKPSINVPLRSAEADFANIARQVRDVGLTPAMPAMITVPMGAMGFVAPQGPFQQPYQRHDDPYDDKQGLNTSFELALRAIAPGLADVLGAGYAAYTHSPDAFNGMGSAIKATARRTSEKTPFVRDMVGWKPPVAGSTDVTDDLFNDKGVLAKLDRYYTTFDPTKDRSGKKLPGSKEGRLVADMFMPGEAPPQDTLGIPPKPPVNALYIAFMQELDRRFKKDVISDHGKGRLPSGGIAFPSQMARYSAFTRQIKDMRKIDEGNMVTWQQRINNQPELKAYLDQHHISTSDPRAVRNFLEQERQSAARQIMFTLKAVEQDFQKRLGDPNFSFDKLDPNQPMLLPPGVQIPEFVPTWPPYAEQLGIIKQ